MTPTLMKAFLELSRSVLNADNFDKNCRVWNDLFQDPSKNSNQSKFGSISVDKSVESKSTGLTISAWIRPTKTGKNGKRLFVVKIPGVASCCLLGGPMGSGVFGWGLVLKGNMLNLGLL